MGKTIKKKEKGIGRWFEYITGKDIKSSFDYISMGTAGVTKHSLDDLTLYLGVSKKMMAENILYISVKTLERKAASTKLDKKISAHAIEIARVAQHAQAIFRDEEKVRLWLNRENKALNNFSPVQLLDTLTGINMVNDVLGRIEEGVYS